MSSPGKLHTRNPKNWIGLRSLHAVNSGALGETSRVVSPHAMVEMEILYGYSSGSDVSSRCRKKPLETLGSRSNPTSPSFSALGKEFPHENTFIDSARQNRGLNQSFPRTAKFGLVLFNSYDVLHAADSSFCPQRCA